MKVPKYLDLEWFSQQGFNFPNLLEVQGLAKLLRMKETFNIKLVKVFYTYAHVDLERNLFYIVNGVDMVADVSMWKEVAGLDIGGVHKFDETTDGYNKMQTYRGMLLDSVPRSDQKHFNQLNQASN